MALDSSAAQAKAAKFDSTTAIRFVGSDSTTVALPTCDSSLVQALRAHPESLRSLLPKALTEAAVLLQHLQHAGVNDTVQVTGAWRLNNSGEPVAKRHASHDQLINDLIRQPELFRLTDQQQVAAVWHVAIAKIVGGMTETRALRLDAQDAGELKQSFREDLGTAPSQYIAAVMDKAEVGDAVRIYNNKDHNAVVLAGIQLGGGKLFIAGKGIMDGATALAAAVGDGSNITLSTYVPSWTGVVAGALGNPK
jgi:hypothetical protein